MIHSGGFHEGIYIQVHRVLWLSLHTCTSHYTIYTHVCHVHYLHTFTFPFLSLHPPAGPFHSPGQLCFYFNGMYTWMILLHIIILTCIKKKTTLILYLWAHLLCVDGCFCVMILCAAQRTTSKSQFPSTMWSLWIKATLSGLAATTTFWEISPAQEGLRSSVEHLPSVPKACLPELNKMNNDGKTPTMPTLICVWSTFASRFRRNRQENQKGQGYLWPI